MMAQDIRSTGQPIALMTGVIPQHPSHEPWTWATAAGYNQWRFLLDHDINSNWACFDSEIDIAANIASSYPQVAGHWNDPDFQDAGFTSIQKQTMFGMTALWSGPILLSTDLSSMSASDLSLYMNPEVIAVDQDSDGAMATRYSQASCGSATCEIWLKPMQDGSSVIGLLNRSGTAQTIQVDLHAIFGASVSVTDLWSQTALGTMSSYSATVGPYGLDLIQLRR